MKNTVITFAFILLVGMAIAFVVEYMGSNPSKNDCVIGRDSPDCLEGSGGHPLWNN